MTGRFGILLVVFAAMPAGAQELHADAIVTSAEHWSLTSPLRGAAVSLEQIRLGGLSFRLGAEYSRAISAQSLPVHCVQFQTTGIAAPCGPVTVDETARLVLGTAGLELRANEKHASLAVFADLGVGSMSLERPGLEAREHMWSATGGAAWGWRFNERWGVRAEAGLGWLEPRGAEAPPESYTPFRGGFHTSRFSLGAFWTARNR